MNYYSNNFYTEYDSSEHFSQFFYNDEEIQLKIQQQNQRVQIDQQKQIHKQELGTNCTYINSNQNHQENVHDQQVTQKLQHKSRKITKIQTSSKIFIKNQFTFSGSKNDTVQLNTNFKTLFKKFIRQNYFIKTDQQKSVLQEFQNSVSSFKAFSKLYESTHQIKDLCSRFIRSSEIITNIMKSRAKFWMRLQMVKYVEALSRNIQSENTVKWKSIRNKQMN